MAIVRAVTENRQELRPVDRTPIRAADSESGEIIARAVVQLGQTGVQAANQLNQRQIQNAETFARDADNRATQARLKHYSPFFALDGIRAMNAREELERGREQIDRDMTTELAGNPMAQRMFAERSALRRVADDERISRHVSEQTEVYETSVFNNTISTAAQNAAANASDIPEVLNNIATVEATTMRRALDRGLVAEGDTEGLRALQRQAVAPVVIATAGALERGDPTRLGSGGALAALAFVNSVRDRIDPETYNRLRNSLTAGANREQADEGWRRYRVPMGGAAPAAPAEGVAAAGGSDAAPAPARGAAPEAPAARAAAPNSSWRVISRPGASRAGGRRVHGGYDIAPSAGNPGWHPTQDFTVGNVRVGRPITESGQHYPDGLSGITADVILADGTRLVLRHLARRPVEGRFRAGQLAAIAGNTGNARNTPTHFHVEATNNSGARIDPSRHFGIGTGGAAGGERGSASLASAEGTDLAATIAAIRAAPELNFEQQETYIAAANRDHGIERQALSEQRENLVERVWDAVNGTPFTDYESIPLALRVELDRNPTLQRQFMEQADRNGDEARREERGANTPTSGSDQFFDLLDSSNGEAVDRAAFTRLNLQDPELRITSRERSRLIARQRVLINQGDRTGERAADIPVAMIRSEIVQARNLDSATGDRRLTDRNRDLRNLWATSVEARVAVLQQREGRRATREEVREIVREEAESVTVVSHGRVWGQRETPVPVYRVREAAAAEGARYIGTRIPGYSDAEVAQANEAGRATLGRDLSTAELLQRLRLRNR